MRSQHDVNMPEASTIASMRNIEFHVSIFVLMVINCIHLFVTYITCHKYRCLRLFLVQYSAIKCNVRTIVRPYKLIAAFLGTTLSSSLDHPNSGNMAVYLLNMMRSVLSLSPLISYHTPHLQVSHQRYLPRSCPSANIMTVTSLTIYFINAENVKTFSLQQTANVSC